MSSTKDIIRLMYPNLKHCAYYPRKQEVVRCLIYLFRPSQTCQLRDRLRPQFVPVHYNKCQQDVPSSEIVLFLQLNDLISISKLTDTNNDDNLRLSIFSVVSLIISSYLRAE